MRSEKLGWGKLLCRCQHWQRRDIELSGKWRKNGALGVLCGADRVSSKDILEDSLGVRWHWEAGHHKARSI
ncbi:hypothetical protein KFK09_013361 [Dendrobium nobile]|uniref:Uncharacterized protein n=1 Tax=Dendrobium nobile TaxID=94219 RepID=A0A8T3BCV9_DENNO|nr:hypothetical protein KFK09_013361 [Dendrobium nobile]